MQPVPIKIQVFPSEYSKAIKVATFFDTEASYTIMNPDVLPVSIKRDNNKKKSKYTAE